MPKVGLLLSGGLDSAILAGLLKQHCDLVPLTFDQANSLAFTDMICKSLDLQYNVLDIDVRNDGEEVLRAADRAIEEYNFDLLYCGITANPPDLNHPDKPKRPDIYMLLDTELNSIIRLPFALTTKDKVLQLGLDNVDEIENLIKYSHSCYTSVSFRCGHCFNCVERQWAFDKCGIKDHGLY